MPKQLDKLIRQLDELFTPQVTTMNLNAFISYCFDDRYTKPFTVSNYAQKLLNEYEISSYIKNDENLKKILIFIFGIRVNIFDIFSSANFFFGS